MKSKLFGKWFPSSENSDQEDYLNSLESNLTDEIIRVEIKLLAFWSIGEWFWDCAREIINSNTKYFETGECEANVPRKSAMKPVKRNQEGDQKRQIVKGRRDCTRQIIWPYWKQSQVFQST